MVRKNSNRFLFLVLACSAAGVVLGGSASWAESNQCLQADTPSSQCLTQDPTTKTLEGMIAGMLAGTGASLGIAFQMKKPN